MMSFMTGVYVTVAVAILCTLGSLLFVMRLAEQAQRENKHRRIGVPAEIIKTLGVEAWDTLAWKVGKDGTVRVRRVERAVKPVECP